ncbi:glycosyltransferase family 1 protein [Pseudolysobacter antarcticus]|uniref:Glycosyltransferase family 1 protein n=1 Tax=Pseudolysobacter antarcticus TaxID=2511995 RepID=A0A411HKN5_9GAMM|nr:glycosyltransferase family 1 protein [Pseudolysobacter antarcticus]QBB71061.1 glycosyltransferase family 1 protein [Pseudolysobacter antarcticus]
MRIAIVTETYPPEVNGVALTVAGLAHGLAGAGHQVQLVRPRQIENTSKNILATESNIAKAKPGQSQIDEVLVRGAGLPRYPGLRFGLPAARKLKALWRAQRPDAIYVATEGPLGYSALRAASALGIPASTGFHTRFDDFARHYGLGFLTPLVFAYLRRFHERGHATLVPTTELAQFLTSNGFSNVQLLRRAVDTQLFSPLRRDETLRAQWGLNPQDLAVLYVGRIAPEKNLAVCVAAFREIQRQQPNTRYIWIGDGPARAQLAAENPDFIFTGIQRGETLARFYASCDLFLFPSITETFGNVTLEAMASGLPTVAFDYGAAREHLLDHCGRRVPFADAAAFIAASVHLAAAHDIRRDMRNAARAAVAELNPHAVTASFSDLLANLATRRAA